VKLLAPGGGFSLRTDARDYALEALDNLEAREDLENRFSAGEWALLSLSFCLKNFAFFLSSR